MTPVKGRILTVEKVKSLSFKRKAHINGGNYFSKFIHTNAEYGISIVDETNGHPTYELISKRLEMDGTEIAIDLFCSVPEYEKFCEEFNRWVAKNPDVVRKSDFDISLEETRAALVGEREARASKMPTEHDALKQLNQAVTRLKELGWRDAIYCPKDGTQFKVVEAGSTGIHDCVYSGEWPKGSWIVIDEEDAYPSRPILYKDDDGGEQS